MFAETDVQSEPESMSVVLLIVFLISLDVYMFPAPFKIRLTARVIARYVYSRCSWIGIFPSCCVDSLLPRKLMLWQTWRELFVVEDGEIFALVVRRQLDDLLLRQIEQNYYGIPMTTCSQTTSLCWIHLWWKVNCFWKFLFHPIFWWDGTCRRVATNLSNDWYLCDSARHVFSCI